jgi:hypothetical protein
MKTFIKSHHELNVIHKVVCLAIVLSLLSCINALASDYKIEYVNQVISIGIPNGYCYLDRNVSTDKAYIDGITQLLKKTKVRYMHGFVDCNDLQEMRLNQKFTELKYGYVSVLALLPENKYPLNMSRNRFINGIVSSLSGSTLKKAEKTTKNLLNSKHFKLSSMSRLQLLDANDYAGYFGIVGQYKTIVGNLKIASVNAYTLIKGVPFVFYLYRPYRDIDTFKIILSEIQPFVENTIKRNDQNSLNALNRIPSSIGEVTPNNSPHFKLVKLPRGVAIEVPKNWWLLGKDYLQLINISVDAIKDLSEFDIKDNNEVNLIAANSMPRSTYASVRVDSIKPPSISVGELENLSVSELKNEGIVLKEMLRLMLPKQKFELIDFYGLHIETIDSQLALVMRYKRTGLKGPVYVERIMIPTRALVSNCVDS